ncbi:Pyrimidine reductase, riboflavin biosynthesis [Nocardioides terrae]|uniref:Pyrimidine reductase, riboflavin biosynthesis n=1 Tax=Nocardioides terrae TaxID=574651 RepID=A0A1I1EPW2_9ACTN|nr:dihydrofolate reductase family protein [Nocardioides terrae]SFB86923.1 Pyrimidine reductase, riboflavin biosynthesis [Nocardioides terrae]
MRTLIGDGSVDELYAWPDGPWLRVNMISSADGAAQGADGLTGSINNEADKVVFDRLRSTADALLVGAGTARAEGYGPVPQPMIVVGRSLPPTLEGAPGVRLVSGGNEQALRELVHGLYAEGLDHVICEGGPTLLAGLLRAGVVEELCTTVAPLLVGGGGKRIVDGPLVAGGVPLTLSSLVEADGTLLARWRVVRHLAD